MPSLIDLRRLIGDPRFLCRTDDIVIESGNARLQPVADAWASGKDVGEAELVSMYRETAVPFAWNAPMYRQFYETVREVNARHLCPHPVRLVLGDPAFDWATIETADDLRKVADRDAFYATVVEREVLAKKHRALLVSGVETVWSGEEIPAYGDRITRKEWRGQDISLERFEEMARFNYGSTVIVLLPPGVAELDPSLEAESPVRLGQRLATLS